MKNLLSAVAIAGAVLPGQGWTETEISVYSGFQTAPHSDVTGNDGLADYAFTAGWDGKSFAMPPYYGLRATWWRSENFGLGAEFTHAKVYADQQTLTANGYDRFEFTDGHNIVTLNASYRWPGHWSNGQVTPYVGAGLGIAVPHVDVQPTGGLHTYGYQFTGPAMRLYAGAKYEMSEQWAVFGEYQFTYSQNSVDLDSGGGFETNLITNALNIGVSYSF